MKSTLSALAAALLLMSPLMSFAQATATPASPAPYSVFVDQPTGFTFQGITLEASLQACLPYYGCYSFTAGLTF